MCWQRQAKRRAAAGVGAPALQRAWDGVYVIGPGGRVVFREAWNHPDHVEEVLCALASGHDVPARETSDMTGPAGRPFGEGLLRGGTRALRDFYQTAPPPVQQRLRV